MRGFGWSGETNEQVVEVCGNSHGYIDYREERAGVGIFGECGYICLDGKRKCNSLIWIQT